MGSNVTLVLFCFSRRRWEEFRRRTDPVYTALLQAESCGQDIILWFVDMNDCSSGPVPQLASILYALVLVWVAWRRDPSGKILFACKAGRHRSVTLHMWTFICIAGYNYYDAGRAVIRNRNLFLKTRQVS